LSDAHCAKIYQWAVFRFRSDSAGSSRAKLPHFWSIASDEWGVAIRECLKCHRNERLTEVTGLLQRERAARHRDPVWTCLGAVQLPDAARTWLRAPQNARMPFGAVICTQSPESQTLLMLLWPHVASLPPPLWKRPPGNNGDQSRGYVRGGNCCPWLVVKAAGSSIALTHERARLLPFPVRGSGACAGARGPGSLACGAAGNCSRKKRSPRGAAQVGQRGRPRSSKPINPKHRSARAGRSPAPRPHVSGRGPGAHPGARRGALSPGPGSSVAGRAAVHGDGGGGHGGLLGAGDGRHVASLQVGQGPGRGRA
jgi:hypothetical protein